MFVRKGYAGRAARRQRPVPSIARGEGRVKFCFPSAICFAVPPGVLRDVARVPLGLTRRLDEWTLNTCRISAGVVHRISRRDVPVLMSDKWSLPPSQGHFINVKRQGAPSFTFGWEMWNWDSLHIRYWPIVNNSGGNELRRRGQTHNVRYYWGI